MHVIDRVCLLMVVGLWSWSLSAQSVQGLITGSVRDPDGAAVVGAEVGLVTEATSARREIKTNEHGDFVIPNLDPGVYRLTVRAPGFKALTRTSITLTASERLALGELKLEVGAVSESITVSGEATPVQTVSAERAGQLNDKQMAMLMSRGRDYMSLLRTMPGVVPQGDANTMGGGIPVIQGVRNWLMTVSVDGVTGNDLSSSESTVTPVNLDAVSEVKVLMTNYQAEYGRSAGAVINAITKSGTTTFHGGGYIYKRHEQFNANSFFNNLNKVAKPKYRYMTGGYTLGGPLYVPGKFNTNKDKLFFFFSQEIIRRSNPGSLQQVTMPTELERAGNFSQTLDVSGQLVPIKDPLNGQPFASNVIPQNRIDPNGQKLLKVFPMPNFLDRSVSKGNYNYLFQESILAPIRQEVLRLDYNPTSKLRTYFRGNTFRSKSEGYAVGAGGPAWGMMKGFYKSETNTGLANITYTFSPSLVNEFQFGAYHWQEPGGPTSQAELDKINRTKLGISLAQFHSENNPYNIIPWMSFGGVPGAAGFSTDNRYPIQGATSVYNIADGLSKVWGSHTLKTGIFIERDQMFKGPRGTFPGNFAFGKDTNNPNDANYAYANAALGNFQSYTESDTRPQVNMRALLAEWYVQDNWKVSRKLTLDYGMRFHTYVPLWESSGNASAFALDLFDPKKAPVLYRPVKTNLGVRVAQNPLTGELAPAVLIGARVPNSGAPANGMVLATDSSYPKGFVDNRGVLYAPRFGFAYDPLGDGKTAVRGGFGITYNPLVRGGGLGGTSQAFQTNPPIQFTPVMYYGNLGTFMNAAGVTFPSGALGIGKAGEVANVYSYSLGVQRDIGFKTVLDVAYVGSLGRHLLDKRNLNTLPYGARFLPQNQDSTTGRPLSDDFFRPYMGYNSVGYFEAASTSNYHSMQVQANRRFSHGLQFGAVWTWSKAMDFGDNDEASIPQYLSPRWNYGKAGYDRTHIVSINWLWDLPKASRMWNNVLVRQVFDNWQFAGVTQFVSGSPSGVGFSTVDGTDMTGGGDGQRIVVTGNPVLSSGERTFTQWFNTSVFARPAMNSIGNAAKDVIRLPGTNNWDLSFFKNFPIKDRARFQFRWEMYNAFNHTQFSGVDTTARFDLQGNQVNSRFGAITSDRGARVMQGSLRFMF